LLQEKAKMTENKFFLRDEYTVDEKEERIRAEKFSIDSPPVLNVLDEANISAEEAKGFGKTDYLNKLSSRLSDDEYNEFIDEMFEEYGRKGDKFNQQLYFLPSDLEIEDLYEKLDQFTGGALHKPFDSILSHRLFLREIQMNDEKVDLRFNTAFDMQEFESNEETPIKILNEEGEEINELEEKQRVRVPNRQRIEARIYENEKVLSLSNSDVKDGIQTEIFNVVISIIIGDSEADSQEVDPDA
jgi:hypothetical protein